MAYGAPPLFRQGVSARARFLFFLMLSLAAILVDGRLRSLDGLRSTVVSFTSPIVEAIHLPGRILGEGQGYFMSKRRLNEEVQRLSEENQLLQLSAARYEEVQQENESLRRLINTVPRAADKVATAEVIGRIADPFSRRIQINIGSREGVEIGMPVIGPFGVLGQISRVVNRLSEVTLLTDHTIRLSVINRRTGAFFILSGTGDDSLSVLFALPSADIRPGQLPVINLESPIKGWKRLPLLMLKTSSSPLSFSQIPTLPPGLKKRLPPHVLSGGPVDEQA